MPDRKVRTRDEACAQSWKLVCRAGPWLRLLCIPSVEESDFTVGTDLEELPIGVATWLTRPGDLPSFNLADVIVRYPVSVRDKLVDRIGKRLPASE
ncbi:hypothetical protein [Actinoplanes philippinensis]|uniref:hypothetical protein n=1 Tax=Actinoplanes philippinensis TaxID=35752 RepID=UPI0033D2F1B4